MRGVGRERIIEVNRTRERDASVIRDVHNELDIRHLSEHRREDAELRGSVLEVLSRNPIIPAGVDATVKGGRVTLQGTVDYRHQRDEAEASVLSVGSVTEVDNEIKVRNVALADDVSARIEDTFTRNAQVDARAIQVDAMDGIVTLKGFVTSWFERNAAIDAAWTAPGVNKIDDQLGIAG
jgi:osmotically-inducible protein OsmY